MELVVSKRILLITFIISGLFRFSHAEDAHVHGSGNLEIVSIKNELEITLRAPAFNFFGFGYEPKTEKEKKYVSAQLGKLKKSDLFVFNDGANCVSKRVEVKSQIEVEDEHEGQHEGNAKDRHKEHDKEHTKHEHEEHEEIHTDVEASYAFKCEGLKTINTKKIFNSFTEFKTISAQIVNDKHQTSTGLIPEDSLIKLRD